MELPDKNAVAKLNRKLKPKGFKLKVFRTQPRRTYPFELINLETGEADVFYKANVTLEKILNDAGLESAGEEWPEIIE